MLLEEEEKQNSQMDISTYNDNGLLNLDLASQFKRNFKVVCFQVKVSNWGKGKYFLLNILLAC